MARDGLDGYRGARPEQLRNAYRQGKPESDGLFNRMAIGIAAEKLMAGVASAEDISAVMVEVIQQAESDAMEGLRALLEFPDPTSPEARQCHFQARVAAQTITYINELVRSGTRAADTINESQESAS